MLHSEAEAEIRIVVGIEFHDLDFAGAASCDLQQHRINDTAGLAPRCPECDKDGVLGLENFRGEVLLSDESQGYDVLAWVHVFVRLSLLPAPFARTVPAVVRKSQVTVIRQFATSLDCSKICSRNRMERSIELIVLNNSSAAWQSAFHENNER